MDFERMWRYHKERSGESKATVPRILLVLLIYSGGVFSVPVFVDDPSSVRSVVITEADIDLVCSTQDPSTIKWVRDGVALGPGDSTLNITKVSDRKSVLYVRRDDSAAIGLLLGASDFTCRANDTSQVASTNVFSFVLGRAPRISRQSTLTSPFFLQENQPLELFCVFSVNIVPSPAVVWRKRNGNRSLELNPTQDATGALERTVSLMLDGRRSQDGTYTCEARNSLGSIVSSLMVITVTYLDNLTISFTPSSRRVLEGNSVSVLAEVASNPPPYNITVSKGNTKKVTVTDTKTLNYAFQAKREDSGNYTITASQREGTISKELHLTVIGAPTGVQFSMSSLTNESFSYEWSIGSDGNSRIQNVTMCCSQTPIQVIEPTMCGRMSRTMTNLSKAMDTLGGLRPNTEYYCALFAYNEVGVTGSTAKRIRTKSAPGEANITCSSIQETSLFLTWTVFNGGDAIGSYIVRYQPTSSPTNWKSLTVDVTQTQLKNLTEQTSYDMEVEAANAYGTSIGRVTCSTQCEVLPEFLADTVVDVDEGQAFQLRVDNRCGGVRDVEVSLCSGESLQSEFSSHSSRVIWVNVTSLREPGDYCINVKVTTGSSSSVVTSTVSIPEPPSTSDDDINLLIIIIPCVVGAVLIIVVIVIIICCVRRNNKGEMTFEVRVEEVGMRHTEATTPGSESESKSRDVYASTDKSTSSVPEDDEGGNRKK
ncbi:neurofascin-like isoform X3 [Oscarella lobularis]|uniref:neurofascin-like isoform X3 n=1 Tax=Oscarella lobularis TaxID=121494 RepID=UPI00331445E9